MYINYIEINMHQEFIGSIPVEKLANDSMEMSKYLSGDGAKFKDILTNWLNGGWVFNYDTFQDIVARNNGVAYDGEVIKAAIGGLAVSTTEISEFIGKLNSYGYEEAVSAALS